MVCFCLCCNYTKDSYALESYTYCIGSYLARFANRIEVHLIL